MSAPRLLHLLRHGEPVLAGTMLGRTDSPATEAGIAACVARVVDLKVARIVTSDLSRAATCAAAIGTTRAIAIRPDRRWRELDFGEWDGRAAADLNAAALSHFWSDPDAFPPPGGERWSTMVERVDAALDDLTAAPTLVVTHAGAMRAALAVLCGFDRKHVWAFDLSYAALLSLTVWPGQPRQTQIVGLRT